MPDAITLVSRRLILLIPLSFLIAAGSLAAALVFAMLYWNRNRPVPRWETKSAPSVAVVVCVRGLDPFLSETLKSLLHQKYSDYSVRVVVDHVQDPAHSIVNEFVSQDDSGRLRLEVLRDHDPNRGLKCSALLQAMESIDEEIVVTIDSDARPDSNWLAYLVGPLEDPAVGATTGNQWFEPKSWNWGSWVRSVWHAGAVVPTMVLGNPWAGAFAMRRSDMENGGLLKAWRTSVIDDGPVPQCLQRLGMRVQVVPETISLNREDSSLRFTFAYIARMLGWSRWFESTFWLTFVHMVIVVGTHIAMAVLTVESAIGLVTGNPTGDYFLTNGAVLMMLWLVQVVSYFIIRGTMLSYFRTTYSPVRQRLRAGIVFLSLPLTLWAYGCGALCAVLVRKIRWRQVEYLLLPGGKVKMLGYRPYRASVDGEANSV